MGLKGNSNGTTQNGHDKRVHFCPFRCPGRSTPCPSFPDLAPNGATDLVCHVGFVTNFAILSSK